MRIHVALVAVVSVVAVTAACVATPDREASDPTASARTPTPSSDAPPEDTRTPGQRQLDDSPAAARYGELPYGYAYPHDLVEDVCGTLDKPLPTLPAPAWLTRNLEASADTAKTVELYRAGFPLLCPQQVPTLNAVFNGAAPVNDGTWRVGRDLGMVRPGTWRITAPATDCYWERTAPGGEILDNQFATTAAELTVRISRTDHAFTTRGCGGWWTPA